MWPKHLGIFAEFMALSLNVYKNINSSPEIADYDDAFMTFGARYRRDILSQ